MNNNFEIGKGMMMHFEFADSLPDLDTIPAAEPEPTPKPASAAAKSSKSLKKNSTAKKASTKSNKSALAALTQQAGSKMSIFASLSAMPLIVSPTSTGTKIITADEEGYMLLPDSQRVMDQNGAPLQMSPGQSVLIGPDNKPVLDQNGEVCHT